MKGLKKIAALAVLLALVMQAFTAQAVYLERDEVREIVESFNSGNGCDEMIYLGSSMFKISDGRGDFLITRNGEEYKLYVLDYKKDMSLGYEDYKSGRYKVTRLDKDTFNECARLAAEVDEAIPRLKEEYDDMLEMDRRSDGWSPYKYYYYQYLHFENGSEIEVDDLYRSWNLMAGEACTTLSDYLRSLSESLSFEVKYANKNVKVLISAEENRVNAIWKDGDDFRVCLEDGFIWRQYENGALGEETSAPEEKYPYNSSFITANGKFYVLSTYTGGTVIQRFDPEKLSFEILNCYEGVFLSRRATCIGKDKVYSVLNGDLVELPLNAAKYTYRVSLTEFFE